MHTQTEKQSALRPLLERIYAATDRESALVILTEYLATSDCVIRVDQRRSMMLFANRCNTLVSLQKYVTNSFLYYEGNGIVKPGYKGRFK